MKKFLGLFVGAILVMGTSACATSTQFESLRGSPDRVLDRIAASLADGDPSVLNDIVGSMEAREVDGPHYRFLPSEGVGVMPEVAVDRSEDGNRATARFMFADYPTVLVDLARASESRREFTYTLDLDSVGMASFPFGATLSGTEVPAGTYRFMPGQLPSITIFGDPAGWLETDPANLAIGAGSELTEWNIQEWLDMSTLSDEGNAAIAAIDQDLCREAQVFFEDFARIAIAENTDTVNGELLALFAWSDCEIRAEYSTFRVADIKPGPLNDLWDESGSESTDVEAETLPVLFVPVSVRGEVAISRPGDRDLEDTVASLMEVLLVSRGGNWEVLDANAYQYSYRWASWQNQYLFF